MFDDISVAHFNLDLYQFDVKKGCVNGSTRWFYKKGQGALGI